MEGRPLEDKVEVVAGEVLRYLKVTCDQHDGCYRTRRRHSAQTAHFGDVEPVGYLGAWLAARFNPDRSNKREHMEYYPSVAEVEEYLRSHGLSP